MRISSASIRSLRAFMSFVTAVPLVPFAQADFLQAMAQRNALVEHKAFAAPAALRLRYHFQIFQDAALEVIDLGKAAREQMRARLLAADAAGAEHRDPAVLGRIEPVGSKILELAEALDIRVDRAL